MAKIPTVNEKLLQRYIRHAVYLEQLKKSEAIAISSFLKQKSFPQLYKKLVTELGKVKNLSTIGSVYKIKRLKRMLAATHKVSVAGAVKAEKMLVNRLVNISKFEAQWNADLISKTVPVDIDMTMPSNEVLKNLVTQRPFEGHKLSTWMNGYSKSVTLAMGKAVKVGVATGESLPAIAKRIEKALGYKTKQAEFIARTAVSSVVHNVKEEVFKRNTDIIRKVQWVSTLDDRTSMICINYDGNVFDVGHGIRPPAHFNCRSTVVPLTPSWQEFGVVDPPAATRASMNGAVPSKMTYKQWIKTQPKAVQVKVLGKKRAELYRSGRVKIDRFVGKDMKPLTLKQLARREGLDLKELDVLPAPPRVKAMSIKGTDLKLTSVDKNALSGWTWNERPYSDITRVQRGLNPIQTEMKRVKGLLKDVPVKKSAVLQAEKRLTTALKKLDGFEGTTYRGMGFDSIAERRSFLNQFKSGRVWKSKTFMASSKLESQAAVEHVMTQKNGLVIVIKGKSGRDITKWSALSSEKEVLFMKGVPLKVDKIVGNKVYLSEITKQAQLKVVPVQPAVKAMATKASGLKLTKIEIKAIDDYQLGDYSGIKQIQLGQKLTGSRSFTKLTEQIKNMDSALEKLPGFNGVSYRGIEFKTLAQRKKYIDRFKTGQVWTSKSFQSTSESLSKAKQFAGYPTAETGIKAPLMIKYEGLSGRSLKNFGGNFGTEELEVLFSKGTSFKVTRVTERSVYLKEITKQAQLKVVPVQPAVAKMTVTPTKVGVNFTGKTSKEFQNLVTKQLDDYPENIKVALNREGASYKFGGRITEVLPELRNKTPRGWSTGSSWDEVSGVYTTKTKSITVAENIRLKGLPEKLAYSRQSFKDLKQVLNHETGHAFDATRSGGRFYSYSNTDKFKAAWKKDIIGLGGETGARKKGFRYYIQSGSAGMEETFAEVFADVVGAAGQPMRINFPNCAKYIDDLLGKKVVPVAAKAKVTVTPSVTGIKKQVKLRMAQSDKAGAKLYVPVDDGLKTYDKALRLISPEAESMMKRVGKSKERIYRDIVKNRKLSLKAGSTKEKYFGVTVKPDVRLKRAKLHDKLLRQILDKVEPSKNPKAILTGGLPGAGKSGVLNTSIPNWKTKYVHVDSDSIKLMLAKADGLTTLGPNAAAYHEEANLILGRVFAKAILENKSILYDGTMRNASRVNNLISAFKKAGYDITAIYADLPLEKSMIRSIGRSYGKAGRFVDPMMQTTHGSKNINTFNAIKEKVNDWKIFDTDVAFGEKPILISSK